MSDTIDISEKRGYCVWFGSTLYYLASHKSSMQLRQHNCVLI